MTSKERLDNRRHALPTGFHGTCRKGAWLTETEACAQEPSLDLDGPGTPSRWDGDRACSVFLVGCKFETGDREAFLEHMLDMHSERPHRSNPSLLTLSAAKRGWKPPRLSTDGFDFAPTGDKPGAIVEWAGIDRETRRGEVWGSSPRPKSVWVRPLEPYNAGEMVELRIEKDGRTRLVDTWLGVKYYGFAMSADAGARRAQAGAA